jgi:hypothetical protein
MFTRVLGLYRGSAKRHMLGPEPGGKFWGIDPFPWGQPESGKKAISLDEDAFFRFGFSMPCILGFGRGWDTDPRLPEDCEQCYELGMRLGRALIQRWPPGMD